MKPTGKSPDADAAASAPPARSRRPTIRDVAAHAGMSLVTVSRVINGHPTVKPSSRERVEAAMRELDYQPDAAAQNMRRESTGTIGFLVPDFTNGVNSSIAQTVGILLQSAGYTLLLACTDNNPAHEVEALRKFRRQRVDGLIIQTSDETNDEILAAIRQFDKPVVLVDRDMDVAADRVISNHATSMGEVIRYLLALGHRDIAFIAPPTRTTPGRVRLETFRREMQAAGFEVPEARIVAAGESFSHGYRAATDLMLANPPTALVAAGNQLVYGAMQALRELNLRFPEDVSLVGADHRMLAAVSVPRLTIIDRNLAELGEAVARLLLDRLTGRRTGAPITRLLPSTVLLNASCAAAPQKRR